MKELIDRMTARKLKAVADTQTRDGCVEGEIGIIFSLSRKNVVNCKT